MIDANRFAFDKYKFDLKKGTASFFYSIEKGKDKFDFEEKIFFPKSEMSLPKELLENIFSAIFLIFGISYYKIYAPKNIEIKPFFLSKKESDFWSKIYTKGLGEFFYKNKINYINLVNFPYKESEQKESFSIEMKERYLLPIGGGKDSIVSSEMLRSQNKDFDIFILGTSKIQEDVAKIMGKKPIVIRRELDPKLFEINKRSDVYNGHIPISVIYAFLGVLAGILYDYKYIAVSNEKSANYGNVEYLGEMINHQWSKSEEFEKLFQEYLKKFVTPSVKYYSPLRQMSELDVAREFVKYPKYFSVFSSCNTNFKINSKTNKKWCGKCAKCLFVFTLLSAFVSKQEVLNIFGKNLFEDKSLLPLFEELLGVKNFKPFECVGTPDEVKEALGKIEKKEEFHDSVLMRYFKNL